MNINKKCKCKSTKLNFLGQYSCEITPLPKCLDGHSLIMNRKNELMVFGGHEFGYEDKMFQDCLVYKNKEWVHHSTLNSPKYHAITINMPDGIYVFGQTTFADTRTTAEFLGCNEHQWKELDTNIPTPGLLLSDGVAISDEEIIFTGGKDINLSLSHRISRFNVKMNDWTLDGNMFEIRWCHKSFVFNDKVIVCGGYNYSMSFDPDSNDFLQFGPKVLNSTEIITVPRTEVRRGGNLNEARFNHRMGILVIQGVPTLAAFGGWSGENTWISSVELWDDSNECWIMSEMSLPEFRYAFASCSSVENNVKGTSASKIY